jgi:predicted Fe-Mo cluster-binding NifX family protein
MLYNVAIASGGGKIVDRHFGRCDKFLIAEIDTETDGIRYLDPLSVEPLCGGGHDEESLEEIYKALNDCKFVLVSRAGLAVKEYFYAKGMTILEDSSAIGDALDKLIKYVKLT